METTKSISEISGDSGFTTNVRNWMHYNSLHCSLSKQVTNARNIRIEYEKKIIANLQQRKLENAIIKTNSGILSIVTENSPKQLTLTRIQAMLEDYFKENTGACSAENIMSYIKLSRGTSDVKYLKLTNS